MFAVIYQCRIRANRETEFKRAWNIVARYFVEKRGAIGSCLHKTPDGLWLAYSRWPDKKTRDASWPVDDVPSDELPEEIRAAVYSIKDCIDQANKLPDICMEVIEDLLLPQPS